MYMNETCYVCYVRPYPQFLLSAGIPPAMSKMREVFSSQGKVKNFVTRSGNCENVSENYLENKRNI